MLEQVWWCDGRIARPFCQRARVEPRGSSRRVQRALTDFGADEAFARAAAKFQEHYGVEVSVHRVRRTTLHHAAALRRAHAPVRALPAAGVDTIIAEADGCMVPTVSTAHAPPGADRRKYRRTEWKEMRLVAARAQGQTKTYYGATMGGVDPAGEHWEHVVNDAGRGLSTRVHGVGDGAPWIAEQCRRRLGPNVGYLLDLFHVCDYLAQVWPGQPKCLRRHRDHLLAGRIAPVMAALQRRLEPVDTPEELAPARRAWRYLHNRLDQLDYPAARSAELPVGSGMIESGHRHVLHQRLKQAGAWWLSTNLEHMGHLRTARANGTYQAYWSRN